MGIIEGAGGGTPAAPRRTGKPLPVSRPKPGGFEYGTPSPGFRYTFPGTYSGYPTGGSPYGNMSGGGGGGGGRGGGRGGGGAMAPAPAAIDQGTFDYLSGLIRGSRPRQAAWHAIDLPDYEAPEFYDFDTGIYDQMRSNIRQGIADDLRSGNQAYQFAADELARYQNPYRGGLQTTNPAMSAAMERMLNANQGAGRSAAEETAAEGVQADRAMGNVLAMLGATDQARQAANVRRNQASQRRFGEGMASEQRRMLSGVDMQMARARQDYDRNKWQYGVDVADKIYNTEMTRAMANYNRSNELNDRNLAAQNEWEQGILQPLVDLILGGMSGGKQTLNLG